MILDNLGGHKGKAVRRAIRSTGATLLFLPKYPPDLKPIEQLFAKLEHWLRRAAKRTPDTVCDAIGQTSLQPNAESTSLKPAMTLSKRIPL